MNSTKALRINCRDNVAIALTEINPGELVEVQDSEGVKISLIIKESIPFGHKIALADVAQNADVIKYGASIGIATNAISMGEHVHTHNLRSARAVEDE